MRVFVKKMRENAVIPYRTHEDDYCYDVTVAAMKWEDGCYHYWTGLAFMIERPEGFTDNIGLEFRSRSSICDTGLILTNGIGTIDEGFRGDVKGVFYHIVTTKQPYKIGDRFGQINLTNGEPIEFVEVDEFPNQGSRGIEGYGSTGK